MNCPKCGSQNADDAKLCYRCYAPLKKSQDRSKMVSSSAKDTNRQPRQRFSRPLIYVSIVVILGVIGVLVVTKTFLHRASPKAKVYEGTQEVSKSDDSKQNLKEISALFKQFDEVLRKDEMIEVVKMFPKELREAFNSKPLQERMLILAGMKIGTAGFTDCKTAVKDVNFQDDERTSARVSVFSECQNPSTGKTMTQEFTYPIVKEEDGWKIDMVAFMKDFDESLKAK
jgi:hypothetical protein